MTWIGSFYRSAVGKKAVMAVTGLFLFGWIFAHMVGNLKVFMGAEHLNAYAQWLRTMGSPAVPESGMLWITRVVMLLAVVFHVHAAFALTIMNRGARPVDYARRRYEAATYAARTMRWGGVIILLFVFYHLAHLTLGADVAPPVKYVEGDVYHNVVAGFQVWWVSAIYIVANLALGLHLYHGLRSMFDSLGLSHPRYNGMRKAGATAFAVIVTAGNLSMPVAALTGILH